jgi:hypothetical protein
LASDAAFGTLNSHLEKSKRDRREARVNITGIICRLLNCLNYWKARRGNARAHTIIMSPINFQGNELLELDQFLICE